MKAISLYEPWATFVMLGWKTIETRTHKRFAGLVGEVVLIHAAKKFDNEFSFLDYLSLFRRKEFYNLKASLYFEFTKGKILGSVYVNSFRELYQDDSRNALINCDPILEKRYGIFLERPCPLIDPIPFRGHQGIFNVPDEIIYEGGNHQ